jgi:hypothetical protein
MASRLSHLHFSSVLNELPHSSCRNWEEDSLLALISILLNLKTLHSSDSNVERATGRTDEQKRNYGRVLSVYHLHRNFMSMN